MNTATLLLFSTALFVGAAEAAPDLPEWAGKIRRDHPRLFFNADTWPAVRERALGPERAWYDGIKRRVDELNRQIGGQAGPEARELGPESAWAAFVYRMTGEKTYLDLAKKALETSLRFYEKCYEERKSVNWYSTSRVHATLTWDWLYNDLSEAERREYLSRLVQVLQKVYTARPPIYRENMGGYQTGFYGVPNCRWFVGLAGLGSGIEEELVHQWLVWGYNENMKLLAHRKMACGDDGGSASPTLGYAFGAYPWSEQNFFYTWLSATGENIAPNWPHSAWLANYVLWNWIETGGQPREFGYGDTPHTTNTLPTSELYTHMANIRHLYGRVTPEAAALARYVQQRVPQQGYARSWFIYPFLLTEMERSPEPFRPERLPHARHFENMGQIFMRSGDGPNDTYCLFTDGGILAQHRHYDALNFVIYHRGHQALDSGTRYSEFENGDHLAGYFAQTAAHNCVLVYQPGEPAARYWGGTAAGDHGGQHQQLGSVVKAFETNDRYVYAAADATACYLHGAVKRQGQPDLPEKVTLVTRQLLFLLPNHFVIFDRVTSTDPSYRKEWLLHTAHQPVVEGKTFRADHEQGRIFCRTLLPADATLTPVGGPGKEFICSGRNWPLKDIGNLKPENLAMMGQWRVAVSPGAPRQEDVFLHVIQVGGQDVAQMNPVEVIEADGIAGARLQRGAETWEVTFRTRGELGGRIRCVGGARPLDAALSTTVTPQVGILALPQ
ncbi:MAG: heparinase II/III family protein [Armatimonadota bacterium]|nr:heparinase II/III family protein [Armatimonadota bacterium]